MLRVRVRILLGQLFSCGTELLRDGPLSVRTQEVGELCHRNIVSESESQVSIFAIEPVAIFGAVVQRCILRLNR